MTKFNQPYIKDNPRAEEILNRILEIYEENSWINKNGRKTRTRMTEEQEKRIIQLALLEPEKLEEFLGEEPTWECIVRFIKN